MRARRRYKAEIERVARENHIARFNKRMELAKLGVEAQKNKNFRAALQYYIAYIDILQKGKNVTELAPKDFDPKADSAELLMLTGIYWDLAKIYDRLGSKDQFKAKYYLDKFVLFSKGTPYQKLSQEMLRKFLTYVNPRDRQLFKDAYITLGGGKCFIATAVEEYCEPSSIINLKRFRDEVLSRSLWGRAFISSYYSVSPTIARWIIRRSPAVQKKIAIAVEKISSAVSSRFFQGGK
jgi:hypothetical protein